MQQTSLYLRAACLLFAAVILVACNRGPTTAVLDLPDVGEYSTKPILGLGAAMTRELGSLVESHRLADHVIGPWEVNAELSQGPDAMAFDGGSSLDSLLPRRISGAALRHRYLAGFSTARSDSVGMRLQNAVLVFPDSAAAEAAVQEFIELAATDSTLKAEAPIAAHPQVSTYIWKRGPGCYCSGPESDSLLAFSAHDRYAFVQNAWSPGALDPVHAGELIAKTVDLQAPLIDQFTPTSERELPHLRVDPTGLLSRAVPVSAAGVSPSSRAIYGVRGTLHFQYDPIRSANTFREAGLVRTAVAAAQVYETQTPEGAGRILEDFYAEASQDGIPRGAVERLPGSSCVSLPNGSDEVLYCVTHVGQFAIEVLGEEHDAKQLLAAQYLLLKEA